MVYKGVDTIIKSYDIDEVGIEELFFNKNVKTAITVAQARGVTLLACAHNNVPIYEYTPPQIKQGVCGYGRADKVRVQKSVTSFLKLKKVPKPDDVADALAIAICHAHANKLDKTLRNDKVRVQKSVTSFLKLKKVPKPDDVADALAIAICHAHANKLDKTLRNVQGL